MTLFLSRTFFEDDSLKFYADLTVIAPGQQIEKHSHEFFELVYVLEGEGEHEYGDSRFRVARGDVFVIEPGMEHAYRTDPGNGGLTVYNILFELSLLTQELELLSGLTSFVGFFYVEPFFRQSLSFQAHLALKPADQLEMAYLLERLVKEYELKDLGYKALCKTRLLEILILLSRFYDRQKNKPLTAVADEQEIIAKVCEFISLHYAQPITLQQVCRLCGMGQTTFSVKFKELVGKTFVEYRNDVRLDMAKRLLRDSKLRMLQISLDVGFEDISHFNRLFKQRNGMSPSAYRNGGG